MPTAPAQPRLAALLWHTTSAGSHYDWLLQPPSPQGLDSTLLTAFRIPLPPSLWISTRSIALTALPAHRKIYLDFQGPLTSRRGFVLRADTGIFTLLTWTDSQIILDVQWQRTALKIRCSLNRQSDLWTLTSTPTPSDHQ